LSALTKIAVVLLVVASLLLSAGVVVFVNKVENFKQTADSTKTQLDLANASAREARAQYESTNAQLVKVQQELNGRIESKNQEIATLNNNILDLKNQIAKVESDKKVSDVALAEMTKAQEGLQQQLNGAYQQVTELRGIRDKLVDERHSLNVQLTDALSKVDALDRARKVAEEKAAGARTQLDDLRLKVVQAGLSPENLPKRTAEGTPTLEGVVNQVFTAGSKPWASISLGSKDNVVKGMQFKVVNNNEFLGYLTIQTTEPNEATGVLDGPNVEKVHAGDQVKTQLQ
jgi:predicted  nucleic acid-binding Zn-ribbon protein